MELGGYFVTCAHLSKKGACLKGISAAVNNIFIFNCFNAFLYNLYTNDTVENYFL